MVITETYEELISFEHLYKAYRKSCRGRRSSSSRIRFEHDICTNLIALQKDLATENYEMAPYRTFKIKEPKERIIRVLDFRDRIVQNLLYEQLFQEAICNYSIYDSTACQKGKGVSLAVERFSKQLKAYWKENGASGYILKGDIKDFYASVDISYVKMQWQHRFSDERIRKLINSILDTHPKGLPMGNQLSQVFAVYYLDSIDRLIKEQCNMKYYSRYMDDFVLLSDDKVLLQVILERITTACTLLHLDLNTRKTQIMPIRNGVDYVGWHFSLTNQGQVIKRLRKSYKSNTQRKLKAMNYQLQKGQLTVSKHSQKLRGMLGHMKQGNTYRYRRNLMKKLKITKGG